MEELQWLVMLRLIPLLLHQLFLVVSLVRCQTDTPAETFLRWLCKSAFPLKAKPTRSFQTFNHILTIYVYINTMSYTLTSYIHIHIYIYIYTYLYIHTFLNLFTMKRLKFLRFSPTLGGLNSSTAEGPASHAVTLGLWRHGAEPVCAMNQLEMA